MKARHTCWIAFAAAMISASCALGQGNPPQITNCPTIIQMASLCHSYQYAFTYTDPDVPDQIRWSVQQTAGPQSTGVYGIDSLMGQFVYEATEQDEFNTYTFSVIARDVEGYADTCRFHISHFGWVPKDANCDDLVDISDAVFLIEYIFGGGPAPRFLQAADANHDGTIDISDVVALIAYIFGGGK